MENVTLQENADRLELVRQLVDEILQQQPDQEERRCGFVHLYGVAVLSTLLALQQGQDPQLCAVAAMLHDIASYQTGDDADHARRSAAIAEQILTQTGRFTASEIAMICGAIASHSDKETTGEAPMAELLKDADRLQHYLYNPALQGQLRTTERLQRLWQALALA